MALNVESNPFPAGEHLASVVSFARIQNDTSLLEHQSILNCNL